MEEYINIHTLIEDEMSNMFKNSVICSLCFNILIDPIICINCQKVFCKKCIENWRKLNEKCPNASCNNPDYKVCIAKKEILSILKFKCLKCGIQIGYFDAKNHYNICCPEQISSKLMENETDDDIILQRIEKMSNEEVDSLKRKGVKIKLLTSKYNILYNY